MIRRVCSRDADAIWSAGRPRRQQDYPAARNEGLDAEALLNSDNEIQYTLGVLMSRYNEEKKILGAVDFDDLIERPLTLLEHPDVLRQLRAQWRYALVDEYQDTPTRYKLQFLRRLMGADGNLCVVGDDDQSIYGATGADQRNILEFERQFPKLSGDLSHRHADAKAPILGGKPAHYANNRYRKEKRLTAAWRRATRPAADLLGQRARSRSRGARDRSLATPASR